MPSGFPATAPAHTPPGRRNGLLVVVGCVLLAALVHALGYRFVTNVLHVETASGGTALSDYLDAAQLVWHGNPYELNYAYPPVFALGMSVLAALPRSLAAVLWYEAQVLSIVALLVLGRRLLTTCDARWPTLSTAVATVIAARFFMNNLLHGNVNAFVLLLALLAALALASGRERPAGLALGLAASAKLLPLLFLPVLLLRGSRRAALWMAATLLALNVVVPVALLGPHQALEVSRDFSDSMITPYTKNPVARFDERNLALSTALQRRVTGPQAAPGGEARILVVASLGAVVALTFAAVWRNRGRERRWAALQDVAVVLAALLLISPKTWSAHYVWLFPAALLLAANPSSGNRDGHARLLRVVLVVAGGALILSSRGVIGRSASEAVRDWSIPTLCALLLWLAALLARPGPARSPDPAVDPPLS